MSRNPLWKVMALVVALAILSFAAATVSAAVTVLTPAGTKVALKFLDSFDTKTTKPGEPVHFHVAADVVVNGKIVIRQSAPVTGTINKVGNMSVLNTGYANITNLAVITVDMKTVPLKDVRVSARVLGGSKRVHIGQMVTTGTAKDITIRVP